MAPRTPRPTPNAPQPRAQGEGLQSLGLSGREFVDLARRMYAAGCTRVQPLMLHGPPGVGKTETVKKLAEVLFHDHVAARLGRSAPVADMMAGIYRPESLTPYETVVKELPAEPEVLSLRNEIAELTCIVISAPLLEPTDIKGVPAIDLEQKLAYWIEPYFLPKKGPGVILIDDITAATRSVVSSLLMLVQQRRVLKYHLPDDVMVIAAGNRVEDLSYCDQLSAAMRSRMTHINFVPDFDEWVSCAYSRGIQTSVIAFLRWKGGRQYFHTTEDQLADPAFACPRTWEHASHLVALGLPRKILREALMGCVGVAAGNEFMMYMDSHGDMPDIDSILADPASAPIPDKIDVLYAVATAVASRARDAVHHQAIIHYAMRLPPEFQFVTFADAIRVNFAIALAGDRPNDGKVDYGGYMANFVSRYEKVLREASKDRRSP